MGLAQAMERHFTQNGTYQGTADNNDVPKIFPSQAPLDAGSKKYNLRIINLTQSSYSLRAIPINSQVGDGILELRSNGAKAWDRDNDKKFAPEDMCWSSAC